MANINSFSFFDRLRVAFTLDLDNQQATISQFIEALEKSITKHPDEWVLYYMLGDKYQQTGKYVDALRVCRKCVELRPNDIRSAYALATAYNILTRANWTSDREKEIVALLQGLTRELGDKLDPILSQAALDKTDMLVETAALQAIRWFERALSKSPDAPSRLQIEQDLKTLYGRFPQLHR